MTAPLPISVVDAIQEGQHFACDLITIFFEGEMARVQQVERQIMEVLLVKAVISLAL
jgi:hypothetical protein